MSEIHTLSTLFKIIYGCVCSHVASDPPPPPPPTHTHTHMHIPGAWGMILWVLNVMVIRPAGMMISGLWILGWVRDSTIT